MAMHTFRNKSIIYIGIVHMIYFQLEVESTEPKSTSGDKKETMREKARTGKIGFHHQ
jgi:hypothetical protein